MKYSGLWFIPSPINAADASTKNFTALINNIEAQFDFATRQSPWALSHRLLRSIPPPSQPPSYQHILQLSHLSQGKAYCYIQPFIPPTQTPQHTQIKSEPNSQSQASTPAPTQQFSQSSTLSLSLTPAASGSIIAIPSSQSDSHISFLCNQFSPLWGFRQALQIPNGMTYTAGQFIIHVGEIRASRAGAASASSTTSPGVVVCVTAVYEDELKDIQNKDYHNQDPDDLGFTFLDGGSQDTTTEEVDWTDFECKVRAAWDVVKLGLDFGKVEVREVMMAKERPNAEGEIEATVRMWCEVLRLRG
ncbi:uncharacterized protein BDR25DRAFT_299390 [Lindgomyces ingoldianus]|uniref:Uncharacterized protein n=1 Tax=Lindgomyces ingoldianus TaxID=673940 RepID=A0ACB6RDX4_9PLEO|nr:uncharacterized protein BDR25DRAFT_299390 [Lindgomyces ingoldianus]KAF2477459.1 hypothetical protein BDR25DRAFT_299390 [Lindgomyces ingoldianus]